MVTTLRAALSVLMLVGFYVVAVAAVAALGWVAVTSFESGSAGLGGKAALIAAVAAFGLVVALWRVARARPEPDPGIVLTPDAAPELWGTVRELAAAADTRVPDEIRLVPDLNAAVSEDARLLGLVPGTRRMYLGVPLLLGLDVAQVRSVLAHELGHYSRSHTRLAPLTYRGQTAILATVAQLSGNVVGFLLRQYAKVYLLVSAGVTRRQELEADELSVRTAGRDTAQSALRELPVLDAAWAFYEAAYLAPGWEVGLAPTAEGFFTGFRDLLAARSDELAAMRAEPAPDDRSAWDTHPSVAARIAAMDRMPDVAVERDTRPGAVLVPSLDAAAAALAGEVVQFGERSRLGWAELTASATAATDQRDADTVFRAAARLAGVPRATLSTVLDLVEQGRGPELAAALRVPVEARPAVPPAELAADPAGGDGAEPTLADAVGTAARAGAVQAGVASWRHAWDGPARLVDASGAPLDLDELAAQAAVPATVGAARGRLAALGVELDAVGQVRDRATAHGAAVLGALSTVGVGGRPHDVVVLDRGLVLVPCPKGTEGGKARLVELVESAPVAELAERHRFVAFEDVATAAVHKRIPVRVSLTLHSGETLELRQPWSGDQLTKDSAEVLAELVDGLVAPAPVAP